MSLQKRPWFCSCHEDFLALKTGREKLQQDPEDWQDLQQVLEWVAQMGLEDSESCSMCLAFLRGMECGVGTLPQAKSLLVFHYHYPEADAERMREFLQKWLLKEDLMTAERTLNDILNIMQGKFKQGRFKLEMDFVSKALRGIKHAWQLAKRAH